MFRRARKPLAILVAAAVFAVALAAPAGAQARRTRRLRRQPRRDPNNLIRKGIALCQGPGHLGGKIAARKSWNRGSALVAKKGYPWFSIPLHGTPENKAVYDKIRGKWVKFYVDTKGGGFSIALMDGKPGEAFHWLTLSNKDYERRKWTRLSAMAKVPDIILEKPSLLYYPVGKNKGVLYDNFRMYLLGTEPPELLHPLNKAWNRNLKNLITDPGIEKSGTGATFPTGWNLVSGGVRLVNEQAHKGKISMKLLPNSRVSTPILEAGKEIPLRVHFWVRGRGTLTVGALDLDEMGTALMLGANRPGDWMVSNLTLQDKWMKVEATSRSYEKNARKRRIDFISGKDSEVYIDDIQVLRDVKKFPPPVLAVNPFKGAFHSDDAKLSLAINGHRIAGETGKITGPAILMLKAVPNADATDVRVSGALQFEDSGTVGIDPHWKYTAKDPGRAGFDLAFDDSQWKPVQAGDGIMTSAAEGKPVWLRRVVLWNVTSYLAPILEELPIDKGKSDWIVFTLNPPVSAKITSYEMVADIPDACELIECKGWGAYYRPVKRFALEDKRIERDGLLYKRYRFAFDPGHITGMPGASGGGAATISLLLIKQHDDMPYDKAAVYLHRVANGNVVDLPTKVDLVHVPLDGTAPKKMMVYMWANPYVFANAPSPQFNIEACDVIMDAFISSGMTHWSWPAKVEPYLKNPEYGAKWAKQCQALGIKMMPVYHHFPFSPSHHHRGRPDAVLPSYMHVRNAPGAVVRNAGATLKNGDPEVYMVSFGWLLSSASDKYWGLLKEEYAASAREFEKATGLEFTGYTWDYEFEVPVYDPLTLKLFAQQQKISGRLTEEIVKKRYSGEWTNFSRWACRQVIQRTYERVVKPLGYNFHVYYGEGRPFDAGSCDVISAYGITQNVPGLMPSVKDEYDRVKRGIDKDPRIRFIGLLQPEIQSSHRRRPFYWQELAANMVKRAVVTQGGGPAIWTSMDPGCPGMTYGCAAASRILAKWEDYFIGFEPVFTGPKLRKIVRIKPWPADVVLLKKGEKGLLLIFGGEPESQPKPVKTTLTFADGKTETLELQPMAVEVREIKSLGSGAP